MDNIDWSNFSVVLVGNAPLSDLERFTINRDFDVVVRFNNMRNFRKGDKTTILCTKASLFNPVIADNISRDTIVWFLKYKGLSKYARQLIKEGKCEVVKRANGSNFTTHNKIYPGPKYSNDKKNGYLSSYGFRMFLYILEKNPKTLSYFGFNWSCGVCGANSKNDRYCCTAHHWKFERKYIKSLTDGVRVKHGLRNQDN